MHPSSVTLRPKVKRPMARDATRSVTSATVARGAADALPLARDVAEAVRGFDHASAALPYPLPRGPRDALDHVRRSRPDGERADAARGMSHPPRIDYFSPCTLGVEAALTAELRDLGAAEISTRPG